MKCDGFLNKLMQVTGLRKRTALDYADEVRLLRAQHRRQDAIALCREGLGHHTTATELYRLLADLYFETEAYAKVRELVTEAGDQVSDAGLLARLGQACMALGQVHEAETAYYRALALDPDQARVCTELGLLLAASGRDAEAEALFKQTLSLDPNQARAWFGLGQCQAHARESEAAVTSLARSLELDPDQPDACLELARRHAEAGRRDQARSLFERALRLNPRLKDAWFLLADLYHMQGQADRARELSLKGQHLQQLEQAEQSSLQRRLKQQTVADVNRRLQYITRQPVA